MQQHSLTASDGTKLSYTLAGEANGIPVLLCHGLGAAGLQLRDDANWFAARGYRVLVPDLRGHGASGLPPQMTRAAFAPERLRADLFEMLDQAGMDACHFVGNSLGGILGLGAAATGAQRRRLRSLAIFGTALALDLPAAGWSFVALDYLPGRRALAWMTARATTRNAAARPLIAAMLRQYDARAAAHIVDHIRHYDLRSAAQDWTGPGLVLVGERDKAVNRALLGQLPALLQQANWRILDLPEGGHCANLDATEPWRAHLLSFWQSVPG